MKLNEKILYYRKAAKLSQEELAVQIGVSRQAVSKWELDAAIPEIDKLLALARIFGVTTDELLSEDDPGANPIKEEPPKTESRVLSEDGIDRFFGHAGRLIRKHGWLAGVYIALQGLGVAFVGVLARWGFKEMLTGGMIYNGVPELKGEILGEFGGSPFGSMGGFAIGFANMMIGVGVLTMLAGAVLAAVLYQKGNRRD